MDEVDGIERVDEVDDIGDFKRVVEGKMFDNADELVKGDGFDEVGLVPNHQY